MAVDNRPFKSKEQDGQGNEVIIRDQQLVEQGTATTMASGACFETRDVDDRPVKIPRDNMMNIVLECIGIILNDSSRNLGTNVQKALGLQGNTVGHSTVADFASVLGVRTPFSIVNKSYQIPSNGSVVMDNTILGGLLILRHNNSGNVGAVAFPYNITFNSINVVAGISISRSAVGASITITNTSGSNAGVVCKVIAPD